MKRIEVYGSFREEGYDLRRIVVRQGGVPDESRNTVLQVLRKLPKWLWNFDDGVEILWDDGTTIPIR